MNEVIEAIGRVLIFADGHDRQFKQLHERLDRQMATLQDIKDAIARSETAEHAIAEVLQQQSSNIASLSQQLKDALAANDPAAIQAVVDQLDADTKVMADAAAAASPVPTPAPTPPSPPVVT